MTDPRDLPPAAQKLDPAGVAAIPPAASTPPELPPPPGGLGGIPIERVKQAMVDGIQQALAEERAAMAPVLAGLRDRIATLEQERDQAIERAEQAEALLVQAEDYVRDLQDGAAP